MVYVTLFLSYRFKTRQVTTLHSMVENAVLEKDFKIVFDLFFTSFVPPDHHSLRTAQSPWLLVP